MEFTERQKKIIEMLKVNSPMTGENIGESLGLSVPTIRADLRLLTAVEILVARPKVGYIYQGKPANRINYDELYSIPIESILLPATKISEDTSMQAAITKLFIEDVGSLYVVDGDSNLVGLISRKDLLRATFTNDDPKAVPAGVIMTRMPNIVMVTPQTTIMEAGNLLLTHEVDSLPVTEGAGSHVVIGKITKNRIFQHFIENGQFDS